MINVFFRLLVCLSGDAAVALGGIGQRTTGGGNESNGTPHSTTTLYVVANILSAMVREIRGWSHRSYASSDGSIGEPRDEISMLLLMLLLLLLL